MKGNQTSEKKYLTVNDRSHIIMSRHETMESALAHLADNGYVSLSGWTYYNPSTRDYCHISEAHQHLIDSAVSMAAKSCGMTVDAYLQR